MKRSLEKTIKGVIAVGIVASIGLGLGGRARRGAALRGLASASIGVARGPRAPADAGSVRRCERFDLRGGVKNNELYACS